MTGVQREDAKDAKKKANVAIGFLPHRNAYLSRRPGTPPGTERQKTSLPGSGAGPQNSFPVENPRFSALNSVFLRLPSATSATPPSAFPRALRIFALNLSHSALLRITLR